MPRFLKVQHVIMGIERPFKSLKRKPVLDYQRPITLHYVTHDSSAQIQLSKPHFAK